MIDSKIAWRKGVYFMADDPTAEPNQCWIFDYEGAPHIVVGWFLEIATGERIPAQAFPLARVPYLIGKDGLIDIGTLLPKELFSSPIPQTIRTEFSVVDVPALAQARSPSSIH